MVLSSKIWTTVATTNQECTKLIIVDTQLQDLNYWLTSRTIELEIRLLEQLNLWTDHHGMKCNPTIRMELKLCQGLLSHMWNTTDLRTRLLFKNFCLPCRFRLVIYTISSLLIMIAGNNYARLQNFSEQLGKMTSIPRRQRNHSPRLVVHTYNNSTKTLAHFAKQTTTIYTIICSLEKHKQKSTHAAQDSRQETWITCYHQLSANKMTEYLNECTRKDG